MKMVYLLICAAIFCLPIQAAGEWTDCPEECLHAGNTALTEQCAAKILRDAEKELDKYLLESKKTWKDSPAVVKAINDFQKRWLDFRKAACGAYSETWGAGTGRSIGTHSCEIDLTRRWTHMIWEYFSPGIKHGKGGFPEPKAEGK
jgi:uncharacterized protein YecT (DUF1311 family)